VIFSFKRLQRVKEFRTSYRGHFRPQSRTSLSATNEFGCGIRHFGNGIDQVGMWSDPGGSWNRPVDCGIWISVAETSRSGVDTTRTVVELTWTVVETSRSVIERIGSTVGTALTTLSHSALVSDAADVSY
jgi:hypothetical protein